MHPRKLDIQSAAGNRITAYCYEPSQPAIAGLVLAPAMAVKQSFYEAFASYMASRGYLVWTFDYYGIGESQQGSMRQCNATVSTWVTDDYNMVINHASTAMAGLPLYVLGHSLGGLITPLLPSAEKLSGIVTIAVGSGAKQYLQPRLQRSTPWLWYLVAPILCSVFGYFPGARIGVMGDMPRHALLQWRRWCLSTEYLFDIEPNARAAYAAINCPLLSLSFSDDELLRESGVVWLHDAYTGTQVEYRAISANTLNSPRIGHFGFFKQQQNEILWPLVGHWLDEKLKLVNQK